MSNDCASNIAISTIKVNGGIISKVLDTVLFNSLIYDSVLLCTLRALRNLRVVVLKVVFGVNIPSFDEELIASSILINSVRNVSTSFFENVPELILSFN